MSITSVGMFSMNKDKVITRWVRGVILTGPKIKVESFIRQMPISPKETVKEAQDIKNKS